ncbi:recombinase family protein [Brevundimonas diminuta]|uniref:recombinase family protein n=2 Tax=Brevundimonas diminuta TaxID=293 RepID=UPI002897327A|nr:recombinase family protein [Brevundimonas diminuta]
MVLPPKKRALYGRHSTDLQNARSTADQIALLREASRAEGVTDVLVFADEAVSGSAIANRPGLRALLAAVERGEVSDVMAEALDRLSRDQEDIAHIYKRLLYAGAVLKTLAEGPIDRIHIGLKGTMNELFLHDLAVKTRRGLVARVNAGFSGGGRCYGYDIVGKGELEPNLHQAGVIHSIFARYADKESPRAIAHSLNAAGEPGPRGGTWTPSTIHGDRRTGDGILHQELYIGVRVFNRRRYRKHPDTGKRSSVLNPPEDWIRQPVPELRIIDDELWARVQSRKAELSALPAAQGRKPKRLLSGLMKCKQCGFSMTLNGSKYNCSGHRERGTCSNGKIIAATTVEKRVLTGIKTHLLSPEAIAEAVRAFHAVAETERRALQVERAPLERELAEIERKLKRAQAMCLDGAIETDELKTISAPLKTRRGEIQARLAADAAPSVIQLHPGAADAYRRLAGNLHQAIDEEDGEEVRAELRKLIDRVDFIPMEGLGKFQLEVHGSLAALLALGQAQKAENPTGGSCGVSLGAGAGFEPATFRL